MPVLMPRLWLWLCFRVYCTGLPALVPSMRPSFVLMHVILSSPFLSALCLLFLLLLPSTALSFFRIGIRRGYKQARFLAGQC